MIRYPHSTARAFAHVTPVPCPSILRPFLTHSTHLYRAQSIHTAHRTQPFHIYTLTILAKHLEQKTIDMRPSNKGDGADANRLYGSLPLD